MHEQFDPKPLLTAHNAKEEGLHDSRSRGIEQPYRLKANKFKIQHQRSIAAVRFPQEREDKAKVIKIPQSRLLACGQKAVHRLTDDAEET